MAERVLAKLIFGAGETETNRVAYLGSLVPKNVVVVSYAQVRDQTEIGIGSQGGLGRCGRGGGKALVGDVLGDGQRGSRRWRFGGGGTVG